MIDQIQMIHEAGFSYNDIKLDNILVGYPKEVKNHKDFLHNIKLVDFGLAKKYLDKNGKHVTDKKEKIFQGNLIFASPQQFNLHTHSRRNDMMSLAYLLVYLIDGDLCFLRQDGDQDDIDGSFNLEEFKRIRKLKNDLSPKVLCCSQESLTLLPFVEEIFSYTFEQEPNYDKLRKILLNCLEEIDSEFDNIYDWNRDYERKKAKNIAQ